MPLDIRVYARTEFESVLNKRHKAIAPQLLDRLEEAFSLPAVQRVIQESRIGLTPKRHEKIHRRQIGRLARSLGHMVAQSAREQSVLADDIRKGYAQWRDTSTFTEVAPRYHRTGNGDGRIVNREEVLRSLA